MGERKKNSLSIIASVLINVLFKYSQQVMASNMEIKTFASDIENCILM